MIKLMEVNSVPWAVISSDGADVAFNEEECRRVAATAALGSTSVSTNQALAVLCVYLLDREKSV